ncbi:recombinase family protein [Streptomyces sp. NPDC050516]|uniref:recombinase family protein n=1 Tax=Streptomyces sp. NPDC050516 TaxID=3365621 RepID=UPI0037B73475
MTSENKDRSGLRALVAIRLSVRTDETTSPARQREAGDLAAERIGAEVVGYAEDLDVSASRTTPFERPDLGKWLSQPDEYDVIIWWRLDRAVRSMADMTDLARWAKQHGKRLVFAEGPGGASLELDMTSIMSELIIMLLAFAAQMEAQAIKERVTGANAALRAAGRYAGGLPPYGYKPVPRETGEGWTLAPDPERVEVIETMVRMLRDGYSPHAIAAQLNADEVMTPRDWNDARQGRTPKGRKWIGQTVKRLLLSPSLIGHQEHDGVTVRDRNGVPVMITSSTIHTRQERAEIQAALDERPTGAKGDRKDTGALLLGVLHCAGCKGRMYRVPAHGYTVYVCRTRTRGQECAAPAAIKTEWAEEYARERFLLAIGDVPVVERVSHPGYDPGPELDEIEAELRDLYATKDARRSRVGRAVWQEQVEALERRAEALEAIPVEDAWVELLPTGRTIGDHWHEGDDRDRRLLMIDQRVRMECVKGQRGGRLEDMKRRALQRLSIDVPGVTAQRRLRASESV